MGPEDVGLGCSRRGPAPSPGPVSFLRASVVSDYSGCRGDSAVLLGSPGKGLATLNFSSGGIVLMAGIRNVAIFFLIDSSNCKSIGLICPLSELFCCEVIGGPAGLSMMAGL